MEVVDSERRAGRFGTGRNRSLPSSSIHHRVKGICSFCQVVGRLGAERQGKGRRVSLA